MLSRLPRISPRAYAWITLAALASLVIIVLSGAAVRVTGSGLGCPTWPECRGAILQTELDSHAAIEYGNRLSTDSMYRHLQVLTSDSLEGRETGREGQRRAARYLAENFQRWGLVPLGREQGFHTSHGSLHFVLGETRA